MIESHAGCRREHQEFTFRNIFPSAFTNCLDNTTERMVEERREESIFQNTFPSPFTNPNDSTAGTMEEDWERMGESYVVRKRKRGDPTFVDDDTHPPDNIDTSTFLEVPSEAQVKQCYKQFYNATSPASLALDVCAVCTAEVNQLEDNVSKL